MVNILLLQDISLFFKQKKAGLLSFCPQNVWNTILQKQHSFAVALDLALN